ncbi:MAG: radical SAM family heme chaperone HemW [Actinomycetota bacterium]
MFGIYVHIPFCITICPYCDFNVYTGITDTAPAYFDALSVEANARAAERSFPPAVSVFFGGGTPSLVAPSLIGSLLSTLPFTVEPNAEITLEANPDGLTVPLLREFRAAGINRLSLGVQSFAPHVLSALGRLHTREDGEAAVAMAREAGFDNVSVDVIFGSPTETFDDWRDTLTRVRALRTEHVSGYGLMIEDGTAFGTAVKAGRMQHPDEDLQADKYELACEMLDGHYEISNWGTKPSRHNLLYWMQGNYVGLGAGAHSHHDGVRSWNHKRPATYMENASNPRAGFEELDEQTRANEWLQLQLRLVAGVRVEDAEQRLGISLTEQIRNLVNDGLATLDAGYLRLTLRGLLLESDVAIRLGAA